MLKGKDNIILAYILQASSNRGAYLQYLSKDAQTSTAPTAVHGRASHVFIEGAT
jgi:hypothetical protein